MKNPLQGKSKFLLAILSPVIFIIIGFFAYLLSTSQYLTAIPGDLGDARFNSIILEHLYQWVIGQTPSLWSPGYFYPYKWVLAFSDNHFGSAWAYIIFRFLGFGREQSFLYWYFVGTLLNFATSFWVFRKLNFSSFAASIGAFVFTFSLPALSLEMHAQLVYRFAIPLAFFFFLKYILNGGVRNLLWSCIWLCIQILCSIYLGVFLIYLLIATFSASFFLHRRLSFLAQIKLAKSPSNLLLLLITFIGIFIAVSMLWMYAHVAHHYGFSRDGTEVLSMTPRLVSYFLADRSSLTSWVGSWVASVPEHLRHEQQMFFGLGVWAAVLIGLIAIYFNRVDRRLGLIALAALALVFLLTISVLDFSVYKLLLFIPGVSSVRVVSRIVLVLLLPISILAAIGAENCLRRLSGFSSLILFILLLAPEVIFYKPYSTAIELWENRIAGVKSLVIESLPPNTAIYISSKNQSQQFLVDLDAMILAQELRLPVFNGYSGNFPPAYLKSDPCNSMDKRLKVIQDLNEDAARELALKNIIQIDVDGSCNISK